MGWAMGKNHTDVGCIEEERQALLEFRYSLVSYSGNAFSWEGKQCCRWEGVKCDGITGHVVTIDLSPKSYPMAEKLINNDEVTDFPIPSLSSKAVSPSLLEFKHLSNLDLSLIDFQFSPIPSFLGSMKKLRYLNLSHCYFSGSVPHHLGNLTNLQILDLNEVQGPFSTLHVDDFIWVSQLSSLRYINMGGIYIRNEINTIMQIIFNLPFLLEADFTQCQIFSLGSYHGFVNSSSLPSKVQVLNLRGNVLNAIPEALQNMTSLRSLDLSDNTIDFVPLCNLDSVPLWLGEFRSLTHLNLARNKLTGFFPVAILNISSVKFLDLSSNNLTSAVPLWFIKRVQHVNLTNNKFSTLESSCPWNSKISCNLKSLDLVPGNKFQGETFGGSEDISVSINSDLQALDLSHNELKDLADSLGHLNNLVHLNLASNLLYGPIPSSLSNLTKLRELILEDNHFDGTISAFLGRFSFLRVLDLCGNHLEGNIPDSLGKLLNLEILDLSDNSFEGAFGEILLHNLSYLRDLRLGMNKLSIELAPNWLRPFQLTCLQLPSCKIETPFPQWLQNQKKLAMLDLSNTSIWGPLPTWFRQKDLLVLDLSNNKISGQLPRNLHDMMPNLISLLLGNNVLNGSIPKSLCKLQGLQDIDLSKNRLSSEIPTCLGEIGGITLIDLSSNELSGTIPKSFCSIDASYSLQSLSLSNNRFHGELPSTLGSCNALEVLDLGNNELYGIIPSIIWEDCSVLKILRLRQNKFSGNIPLSLCQLPVLQSLDLARNNLKGTIPFCLGNLKGMIQNPSSDEGSKGFLAPEPALTAPTADFDGWDKEHVKQVMKGRELEFTKNLKFVVNLDLSNNSLSGSVPEVLTSLIQLVSLNLSHNHLSGEIPSKIGKLRQLESLDLSWNQLAGPFPSSMPSLTSLNHLNMSHNNFSGPIPEGNQFFTLEDPSIYAGNQYLCGEPVLKKCSDNNTDEAPRSAHFEDKNEKEKILFYFVVALGFMTGFWGIIGLLVLNKSLRYVCFRYMEKIADEIYVAVAIRAARLKRMGLKLW
ncbi:receptor-like protein EIX2 [Neltuma alba]|uniref:receptor-like protein EIX2 n=1 Tax=Neltuma alba TaxID=207710 RepID=UPI0010A3C5E9|nr:receptor-like protein EIX2 [Prosopis alba]